MVEWILYTNMKTSRIITCEIGKKTSLEDILIYTNTCPSMQKKRRDFCLNCLYDW